MSTLLDRLRPHWPTLHEKAGNIAPHVQLGLTAALMLALFMAPSAPTVAKPSGSRATGEAPAAQGQATQVRAPTPRATSGDLVSTATLAAKAPPASPHAKAGPIAPVTPAAPAPARDDAPSAPAAPAPEIKFADLPDTGQDYRKIRRALINRGFKPARVAPPECRGPEPSVDACWGALVEFPEIESCQGQNGATCVGWWVAADGRVLKIRTGGEHARITDRHWASPGELDELPSGWRP